jgi:hypothetical protein
MRRRVGLALLVAVGACSSPAVEKAAAPDAERSIVLVRLSADGRPDLMPIVQRRLLSEPLSGRVTTHGYGPADLYSLTFEGSCAGAADLVAAVVAVAREAGAPEASCVPASRFAPGEPLGFRR